MFNDMFTDFSVFFFYEAQLLHLLVTDRDDHPAIVSQLFNQWFGNLGAARSDNYAVKRRFLFPAGCAVVDSSDDVEIVELVKYLSGLYQEGINSFYGKDPVA